jgi:mRNA-degrading endonuclease RelE of RelBE toxin-antitoxin system
MALNVEWSEEARGDIRRLDRSTAHRIFDTVLRFARTGQGDLKQLHGELEGKLRLRGGDYRLFVSQSAEILRIHAVRHRREAYR